MNFSKLRAFSESPIPRRAIDYIKNQVSMLEWDIAVKDGKMPNSRQQKEIDKVKTILQAPNSNESWRTFIEQTVEDMLVVGYASIEKRSWATNPDKPFVLYPFDAASLNLYPDWNGSPTSYRYAQVDKNAKTINFTDEQIMFLRYNPRTNSPWGLSPLEVAAQSISYLLETQAYAGRASSNTTAKKAISLGEDVDQEQVKEFRNYWRYEVEGRGHTPIFGGTKGAQSIELGASNDEQLFLKWQQFLITQIANAFGLDALKFGAVLASRASADTYDNASDEGAVRPLAHTIAASINREIVQALGFDDIEFCFRWTANYQDRKSLASIHQIYLTQDVITIDEARKELGLPPLPEGKGKYTLAEYRAIYSMVNTNTTTEPGGVVQDQENDGLNPGYNAEALQTDDQKPMNQPNDPLKADQ